MSPKFLTTCDPGTDMGWATFRDGALIQCGLGGFVLVGEIVVESPQAYRNSKVDPNSLLVLARKVGRLEEAAERLGLPCTVVLPREWKGQVKKDLMCERILGHLRVDEVMLWNEVSRTIPRSKRHNVLDAVGLGLFHLGRMKRGGTQ